jgi:hypothetical protein
LGAFRVGNLPVNTEVPSELRGIQRGDWLTIRQHWGSEDIPKDPHFKHAETFVTGKFAGFRMVDRQIGLGSKSKVLEVGLTQDDGAVSYIGMNEFQGNEVRRGRSSLALHWIPVGQPLTLYVDGKPHSGQLLGFTPEGNVRFLQVLPIEGKSSVEVEVTFSPLGVDSERVHLGNVVPETIPLDSRNVHAYQDLTRVSFLSAQDGKRETIGLNSGYQYIQFKHKGEKVNAHVVDIYRDSPEHGGGIHVEVEVIGDEPGKNHLVQLTRDELLSARRSFLAGEKYTESLPERQREIRRMWEPPMGGIPERYALHAPRNPEGRVQEYVNTPSTEGRRDEAERQSRVLDRVISQQAIYKADFNDIPFEGSASRPHTVAEYRDMEVNADRMKHLVPMAGVEGVNYMYVVRADGRVVVAPQLMEPRLTPNMLAEGQPILAFGNLYRRAKDNLLMVSVGQGQQFYSPRWDQKSEDRAEYIRQIHFVQKTFHYLTGEIPLIEVKQPDSVEEF